jgi:ubiquinol-cytochrome c reductase cytochrome c subunit
VTKKDIVRPRSLGARLSAKRRSPFAGLVVLLLGLLVSGGAYAALAPASADTSTTSQSAIEHGRQLFLVSCSSCHGQHGEGIVEEGGKTNYGPPLIGVGAADVDFQVGTGRMPLATPGQQAETHPVTFTPKEIRDMAAFVASLGPGPAIPEKSAYDTQNSTTEEIVKGGDFFRTNCTACHNFAGAGGALPEGKHAPALTDVSNKHIFEAMIIGPQQMPVFSNQVIKPQEKRDIIAYLNSIRDMPKYGGSTLGSLGPVSEGLWAWVVGIGSLVAFAVWIASHTARSTKKKGA